MEHYTCPNCLSTVPPEEDFCPACGAAIVQPEGDKPPCGQPPDQEPAPPLAAGRKESAAEPSARDAMRHTGDASTAESS